MVARSTDTAFVPGKRVNCGGNFGTIKYVGPVEGYSGIWLGIDWDIEERGKHNGSVNGIHYFDTRLPKSGSLIRKEKVELGQTVIDSIKSRYGFRDNQDTITKSKEELLKFQQKINAPFLQFVGFEAVAEKQRDFQSLEVVNVRLENVSSIGDLVNVCPNIREIDISKNLLSSWTDVFSICSQLRHLQWLNVSENLLVMPESIENYAFPGVNVLICGSMELTFEQVIKLSAVFPNIEELRVPYNHITHLTMESDHNFKRLKYLDLEGNIIKYWFEIMKLSAIETLQILNIDSVKLESIKFEEIFSPVPYFNKIESLNLNNNCIFEWQSIGDLNKLERLENLRFSKNPILETETVATREQIVIAKIKNLKYYNGRHIQDDERRGAEIDYIKKYALQWLKCKTSEERQNFLLEHNRFTELIELYGLPEENELIVKPNIIESSLIQITVKYKERSLSKKLPPNILIQKLILLIQKLFKLKERPTLIYTSAEKPDIKINLCDDLKELNYYSVENGDTIIVQDD